MNRKPRRALLLVLSLFLTGLALVPRLPWMNGTHAPTRTNTSGRPMAAARTALPTSGCGCETARTGDPPRPSSAGPLYTAEALGSIRLFLLYC